MHITLSKGGTGERKVKLETLAIPDLWHIALESESHAKKAILETWHIAHDLKRELLERESEFSALREVEQSARNLETIASLANARQHAGCAVRPHDWIELFHSANQVKSALAKLDAARKG